MAVAVADGRTIVSGADSTTGWTGTDAPVLFTADPPPVELTGSLGNDVSAETHDLYFGISSTDLTDTLIYCWVLANGIMDVFANGGIAVILYDGTNKIGYHIAGSDKASFRYNNTNVSWQCLVLDTGNLPTSFTERAGSEASLNVVAITGIGVMYKTLSKAIGGVENCFTDIIRRGNEGLLITAGTSVDTGKYSEIATADSSDADGKAYGIIHEIGSGLFGLQAPLTHGDNVGTLATYFADTDVTIAFEDRGIATNKYKILIVGNATGATVYQLGTQVGTTTSGANGCSLTCPSGVGALFDASDANVDTVDIFGSILSGFSNGILFSSDATNGITHKIYGNSFNTNGQIEPGATLFKNNSISASTSTLGALLLGLDGNTNWQDLSFTSSGTGHAIYITATGTYTFDNYTYSGYGADGTTDAVVYNNSGGAVTINVLGGDSPTVLNGTSATTTVIAGSVTTAVNVKALDTGLTISGAIVLIEVTDNSNFPYQDSVTITGTGTTATATHTAHGLSTGDNIIIRGANEDVYNGVYSITVTGVDNYTYTTNETIATTPATGTITGTFAIISTTTDVNGDVSDTRVFSVDQPFSGRVRKSSASPFYQSFPFTGTVDSATGFNLNVSMVKDE